MMSDELVGTARLLARPDRKKPRQADLRRSVSTAYYAVFHALARECADQFIGTSSTRSDRAWSHVYRALDHGFAKRACQQARGMGFPRDIVNFAELFILLQEERHRADYDPDIRYSRPETLAVISNIEKAISAFYKVPRRDRAAFAAQVLLKRRSG
jgi:hypothetical protein